VVVETGMPNAAVEKSVMPRRFRAKPADGPQFGNPCPIVFTMRSAERPAESDVM